jgi:hypothetical protein
MLKGMSDWSKLFLDCNVVVADNRSFVCSKTA